MIPPGSKRDSGQAMEILQRGTSETLATSWTWRDWDFWVTRGMHFEYLHSVAPDGVFWGAVGGGSLASFDRTQAPKAKNLRIESLVLGSERSDTEEWLSPPHPLILDSSGGPVVLVGWNYRGAYVVRFASDEGVSKVVPILFENDILEYGFHWQWAERVLWAETSLYWKAYHLPDLGLSGPPNGPFWVVNKTLTAPHPERGIVRESERDGSYRIEHVYRDPLTLIEERRVSDSYQGRPIAAVSPSGRRGVLIEKRMSAEGLEKSYARHIRLSGAPPLPAVEADIHAERDADRPNLYAHEDSPILFYAARQLLFLFGEVGE